MSAGVQSGMYDAVLVGTDGSDDATLAIDHAIAIATQFEIPVHGLSVVETRTAYDTAIVDPEAVRARLRSQAEDALSQVTEATRGTDCSVVLEVREGIPHQEICTYADEHDISLIVMGSSGRSSFKEILLGSTVDAVVRLSDVPVLVVGEPSRPNF